MLDEEFAKRLADYFTPAELVALLDIETEDLVYLLEDYIVDKKEDLDDYVAYGA